MVLHGLMHVDGVLVDQHLGAEQVHLTQDPRPVRGGVNDDHVLGRSGSKRDLRGRKVLRAPVPAPVVRLADVPALTQVGEEVIRRTRAEPLAGLERPLERSGAQVRQQDVQVVRVQPGLFRPAAQEELRVVDHVLVNGCLRGHEDCHRDIASPAGPAHLLPGGGDGARVAREDRNIQAADVHAQLEGVGRDDAQHLAIAQASLDGAPLRGQVATPVAADPAARPEVHAQGLAQVGQHDLHRDPALAEDHRLAAGTQEGKRPALRERKGGAAGARGRIDHRRVHQEQVLLARRRAVAVDQADRPAHQGLGQLRRVADGGRAADDHGLGSVVLAQAQEPPQDVGHVGAEDAAVRVQLVDHDHAELLEQLEPLGVVGEDGRVEHVRVGDHHLARLAHSGPDGRRRVPVVAGGADLQPGVLHQLPELGGLVLAQRLGGEEEERARGRILREGLEHRHGVAERLAGRGGRDHHDVLAGVDRLDGIRLVGVRPLDAAVGQACPDARVKPLRPVRVLGGHRLTDLVVDHAACQGRLSEEPVQDGPRGGGCVRAHVTCSRWLERPFDYGGV